MNTQKTTTIVMVAIATIALALALSQTQVTSAADAPKGNNVYVFAEGVTPEATFQFRDATATYEFQAFTQLTGFSAVGRGNTPEFTLQKVAGDTPYLYEAVDQTHEFSTRAILDFPYKEFNVTVNLMQAGQPVRTFDYNRCQITGYKVITEFDKEEGYTTGGKTGFAVMDQFTFTCGGYMPQNPVYEEMTKPKAPY
jgi:hypothetical protein